MANSGFREIERNDATDTSCYHFASDNRNCGPYSGLSEVVRTTARGGGDRETVNLHIRICTASLSPGKHLNRDGDGDDDGECMRLQAQGCRDGLSAEPVSNRDIRHT